METTESATQPGQPPKLAALLGQDGVIVPSVVPVALDARWQVEDYAQAFQLADGKAPIEFRIFRAGLNESVKGNFIFDEEAAQSVMTLWAGRKLDLMMDYEHMSLVKPPVIAPASAKKFVPEVRNGELWATQIQWTERAREMLEAGEYRYFSPAFHFDPETMRVYYLINVALTNNPALDAARPLMAASAVEVTTTTTEPKPMPKIACTGCTATLKAKDEDGKDGDEMYCSACLSAAKEGAMGKKVLRVLGLSMEIGEPALLSSVEGVAKFRTEAMALTGQTTVPAALGVIEGWKAKAAETDKLKAEKGELEYATLSAGFEAKLEEKVKALCITPAEAQAMLAGAKDKDGRFVKDRVEYATGILSTKTVAVAAAAPVAQLESGMAIDATERAMALKMGKNPDEYAKWKADAIRQGIIPAV